ncbi:MAG: hypothetical protein ABL930_02190, partial [Pseudobdellovibrio sp.]
IRDSINAKTYDINDTLNEAKLDLPEPSSDVLHEVSEKSKSYKPAKFEMTNELKTDSDNMQRFSEPFVAKRYIMGLESFRQKPYKINERSHSHTRNIDFFNATYEFNENRTRKVEMQKINVKNKCKK